MTTPALPDSCAWVSTVDEAAGALADGQIPLIDPSNKDRAKRWARVMHWYEPGGMGSAASLDGKGATAVVVSTSSAEANGRLAAAALRRPHHHVETVTDTKLLPSADSVLLAIPAADATLSALTPALAHWEGTGTRVGLLTGRDRAGIVFSLAKMLAARTTNQTAPLDPTTMEFFGLPPVVEDSERGRTVVYDGRTGDAHWLGDLGGPIKQVSALQGNWYATVITAEGNASHAWLDGNVLCGLSRPEEYDLAGREVVGGCLDSSCKLAPNVLAPPLSPHRLRTFVLVLLVPNAIAIGRGERYPSEISLALDALEGYPAAVLGLTRGDVHPTGLEADVAGQLLHAGTPVGQTSGDLSRGFARRGLSHAVLLLGDPEYAPPAAQNAEVSAIEIPAQTEIPVTTNGQKSIPTLVVGSRALLAEPDPDARVNDALPDVTDLLSELRGWPSRLAEAELVEDVLAASQSPLTVSTQSRLNEMKSARMAALHEVASTIRHVERQRELREPGLPANPDNKLNELAKQWAVNLVAVALAGPEMAIDALTAGLIAHHHIGRRAPAGPCDQCGAPCVRQHYASFLPIGNRTVQRCPRCGIISSQPDGGGAVMLKAPSKLHRGRPAGVEAVVDGAWGATGFLCAQLRPTAGKLPDAAVYYTGVEVGVTSFAFDVPPDAALDLHRIWVSYASRFQVAVAQARVPVVPTFDPETGDEPTNGAAA